jgi:hypothetical protein
MVLEMAANARQKRKAACAPSCPGDADTADSNSAAPSIQLMICARGQRAR